VYSYTNANAARDTALDAFASGGPRGVRHPERMPSFPANQHLET